VRQVVLATRNPGKIKEFERLLAEHVSGVQVLGLNDFPNLPDVEETGDSFEANALLKAREVSAFSNLPALADDSGLCIDALNGDPGIYSARWAGGHGDDRANVAKVLQQLEQIPITQRGAHFQCAVALHLPDGTEVIRTGQLKGVIVSEPRGAAGFGYDPIFQPVGFGLTLGEFGAGEKDRISHRGQALRAITEDLTKLL